MRLFGRKRANPIHVSLNVRAFIEGQMVRVSVYAQAHEGDSVKGLLKQLRRERTVQASLVRYILKGDPSITVLQNGQRLMMPQAAAARLSDGDALSILTPVAGG